MFSKQTSHQLQFVAPTHLKLTCMQSNALSLSRKNALICFIWQLKKPPNPPPPVQQELLSVVVRLTWGQPVMTAAALQHQVSQHPWTQKSHPAPANSPAVVLHSDFEKVQMLFWWGRHLPSQQLLTLPECQTNRDGLPCGTFGWIINTWIHCWSSAATGVEAVAPWSPSARHKITLTKNHS